MDKKDHKNKKVDTNVFDEKIKEFENNWKRALADYKNLEKRSRDEKEALVEFSNIVLIERLLPVLDNFEMIERHSNDMGVKMSIKEFKQILESTGLKEVELGINQNFDHTSMDAIETVAGEKNKIMEIIRKGYFFKNKLIRPASVKVGNGNK